MRVRFSATAVPQTPLPNSISRQPRLPWFDYAIKSSPQETERALKQCRDRRHCGNRIIDAVENKVDLFNQLGVCGRAGKSPKVYDSFSHGLPVTLIGSNKL